MKQLRFSYVGKMKDLTRKEIWMLWHGLREIERLEAVDFSKN